MKYLLFGTTLSLISILLSFIIWDIQMVHKLTGAISLIFFFVAMVFSGALINGDKIRANYMMESKEDRKNRNNITFRCLLIALPNFIVGLVFYFLI
ncbi:MAG: DUF5316 domain-containing protein [Solibacillus sp.]|uniref:DUF5316 domain-containing protein n=1 Tax=unclassified Solibacillus TaxID=2637870 RepID=UPI0030FA61B8